MAANSIDSIRRPNAVEPPDSFLLFTSFTLGLGNATLEMLCLQRMYLHVFKPPRRNGVLHGSWSSELFSPTLTACSQSVHLYIGSRPICAVEPKLVATWFARRHPRETKYMVLYTIIL